MAQPEEETILNLQGRIQVEVGKINNQLNELVYGTNEEAVEQARPCLPNILTEIIEEQKETLKKLGQISLFIATEIANKLR